MTDRQLPLEPTVRIDPTTQVVHMPGTDAICMCRDAGRYDRSHPHYSDLCGWPFCGWKDHINDEEDA